MSGREQSVHEVHVPIQLRKGWSLVSVWADLIGLGPVVLAVFKDPAGRPRRFRMDLDKRAFYDEVPEELRLGAGVFEKIRDRIRAFRVTRAQS